MNKVLDPAEIIPDGSFTDYDRLPVFVLSTETCKVISLPNSSVPHANTISARPASDKASHTPEQAP